MICSVIKHTSLVYKTKLYSKVLYKTGEKNQVNRGRMLQNNRC